MTAEQTRKAALAASLEAQAIAKRENAKHTPGPWEWWTSCSFRRLSSRATGYDGDVMHAVVQRSDGHPDIHFPNGGVTGPDARLIAAAPELLEALVDVMFRHVPFDNKSEYATKARAVIAKATGETP